MIISFASQYCTFNMQYKGDTNFVMSSGQISKQLFMRLLLLALSTFAYGWINVCGYMMPAKPVGLILVLHPMSCRLSKPLERRLLVVNVQKKVSIECGLLWNNWQVYGEWAFLLPASIVIII